MLTDSIPDDYTYGIEFNDAYKFALTNSITTAKTIKQANMT
ncbi:MAG: hypothetical protein WCG25_02405 [bacterium]